MAPWLGLMLGDGDGLGQGADCHRLRADVLFGIERAMAEESRLET